MFPLHRNQPIALQCMLNPINRLCNMGTGDEQIDQYPIGNYNVNNGNNEIVLVSLLLTLKRFHTLFWCFYWWHWTCKCRLSRIFFEWLITFLLNNTGHCSWEINTNFSVLILNFDCVWHSWKLLIHTKPTLTVSKPTTETPE